MSVREFVDTKVLVYAFDATAGPKRAMAAKLIDRLWQERAGCVSIQILQEFYVSILWTEDLTDGQKFEPVTIRNPFA